MKYKLEISDLAATDFAGIVEDIRERRGEKYVDQFFLSFLSELDRVLDNPYCYSLCPELELQDRGFRRFRVEKYYRAIYKVDDDLRLVVVDRIFYAASDIVGKMTS